MELTLIGSALMASIAAGTFLAAGVNMRRAEATGDAREALMLFSLWWVALSVYAVAGATLDLSAALGAQAAGPALVFHFAQAVALCIGLWGLVYYVAFVFTGRRSLLPVLAIFFALYYGIVLFWLTLGRPIAVAADAWRARIAYEDPLLNGALAALLFVLPILVAAATYLLVILQARELSQRWRIVLVCLSTVAWGLATLLRSSGGGRLEALTPLLALASGLAITWAYRPPQWVQRRLDARAALAAPAPGR